MYICTVVVVLVCECAYACAACQCACTHLFAIVGTAAACVLRILAGQRVLIEHLVLAATDQTWMTLDAGDQAVAVALNGEAWEGPEASGHRIGIHLGGALEADDSCKLDKGMNINNIKYICR